MYNTLHPVLLSLHFLPSSDFKLKILTQTTTNRFGKHVKDSQKRNSVISVPWDFVDVAKCHCFQTYKCSH